MFTPIYNSHLDFFPATGSFLLGLAENACQEWTTLAKKDSLLIFY
jgi:hypothetical protein